MIPKGFFLRFAPHCVIGACVLVIMSFAAFFVGFRPSIQFTGGIAIEFADSVDVASVRDHMVDVLSHDFGLNDSSSLLVSQSPVPSLIIPFSSQFSPQGDTSIRENIEEFVGNPSAVLSYKQVGPSFGEYARSKSLTWLLLGIGAMVIYIFFAFAELRKLIDPFHLSLIVVATLIFDIMLPLGIYGVLMMMYPVYMVDTLVILAVLSIMGYSINDTIIILDRMRENLDTQAKSVSLKERGNVVDVSISETLRRSIFTSFSTLLVTLALAIFGQGDMQRIALIISFGVVVGTISSIFVASPTLLLLIKYGRK